MIILKTPAELETMRRVSRVVGETLKNMEPLMKPGVSTREIDEFAENSLRSRGVEPGFKGYRGYPATVCASRNETVVHGIPCEEPLEEGDIVSIDLGGLMDGFYGDSAVTFPVGKVSPSTQRLMDVAREALERGIEKAQVGGRLQDISWAIQSCAEEENFSVVRDYVGHGIGRSLHEDPQVPNFGQPGNGPRLREGMVLAIEPMVNAGSSDVRVKNDGWAVVTSDGRLSAHFEHTVAITEAGPEVLTRAT